jgi:RNA polymerase sigma-70 factor (ECF subfamily)
MARGAGDLAEWLEEGYAPAFRTACLILHNRADAEEAVQEAFLRAWRFRAAVPAGEGVQPWLYRVVVNACLSKLRAETRHRNHEDEATEFAEMGPGPEGLAVAGLTQSTVLAALADLPEHLRVVVALRYYAGLTEREIAAIIHRRPGTVKSRIHEAKSRLGADPRVVALRDDAASVDGSPS